MAEAGSLRSISYWDVLFLGETTDQEGIGTRRNQIVRELAKKRHPLFYGHRLPEEDET